MLVLKMKWEEICFQPRSRAEDPRPESVFALKHKIKKRNPLMKTEGSVRGQHKTGKGKAQKFVQVITIFVKRP
jgi:hypothetical protein